MSTPRGLCLLCDFERSGIHHHHKPLMSTSSSGISFDVNEFTDKRVLVTGGTKGAGKAIADRFQHGGATVIITARSAPTEKTDNHFIQADVSTAEGTTKVINEILNRFQGIDIIVHNVVGASSFTFPPSSERCLTTIQRWPTPPRRPRSPTTARTCRRKSVPKGFA